MSELKQTYLSHRNTDRKIISKVGKLKRREIHDNITDMSYMCIGSENVCFLIRKLLINIQD